MISNSLLFLTLIKMIRYKFIFVTELTFTMLWADSADDTFMMFSCFVFFGVGGGGGSGTSHKWSLRETVIVKCRKSFPTCLGLKYLENFRIETFRSKGIDVIIYTSTVFPWQVNGQFIQLTLVISTRLSRITAYLEVKVWSLPIHENLTTGKKYCGKEEKLEQFGNWSNFSSFPQYFQYFSIFKGPITYIFVKCGSSNYFFLNSGNLICRSTGISKYFRESLGIRDNESRLYYDGTVDSRCLCFGCLEWPLVSLWQCGPCVWRGSLAAVYNFVVVRRSYSKREIFLLFHIIFNIGLTLGVKSYVC